MSLNCPVAIRTSVSRSPLSVSFGPGVAGGERRGISRMPGSADPPQGQDGAICSESESRFERQTGSDFVVSGFDFFVFAAADFALPEAWQQDFVFAEQQSADFDSGDFEQQFVLPDEQQQVP